MHKGHFRAHIHVRNEAEKQMNIYGPNRDTEPDAQKDLDQIRAAGGVGTTREEGLKIMEAESKRIQMSAEYQKQIQQTIHRMASQDVVESDAEIDDDDLSVVSEESCIHGYKSEDETQKYLEQIRAAGGVCNP